MTPSFNEWNTLLQGTPERVPNGKVYSTYSKSQLEFLGKCLENRLEEDEWD